MTAITSSIKWLINWFATENKYNRNLVLFYILFILDLQRPKLSVALLCLSAIALENTEVNIANFEWRDSAQNKVLH